MAERTIRYGIVTYRGVDGRTRFGQLGDVVDVHEDDIERFDRLNPAEPADAGEQTIEAEESDDGADAGEQTIEAEESDDGADAGEQTDPYDGIKVADLKAEIENRNKDRAEDAKIVPAEPGNRPELVAALVADDTAQAAS